MCDWFGGRLLAFEEVLLFFEAEDGIRVLTVTGVQTCALPIYRPRPAHPARRVPQVSPPAALSVRSSWRSPSSGCPWQVTRDLPPGRTQVWDRHPSSTLTATCSHRSRRRTTRRTRPRARRSRQLRGHASRSWRDHRTPKRAPRPSRPGCDGRTSRTGRRGQLADRHTAHARMQRLQPAQEYPQQDRGLATAEATKSSTARHCRRRSDVVAGCAAGWIRRAGVDGTHLTRDRKSTRLNSSHSQISYAVFC